MFHGKGKNRMIDPKDAPACTCFRWVDIESLPRFVADPECPYHAHAAVRVVTKQIGRVYE